MERERLSFTKVLYKIVFIIFYAVTTLYKSPKYKSTCVKDGYCKWLLQYVTANLDTS